MRTATSVHIVSSSKNSLTLDSHMLKYLNTGVVFQEIPDEVTLSINLTNCPCHCPHCHSQYLWQDTGTPLTPEALDEFMSEYGNDITCICFMGGDAEPLSVCDLADYLHATYPRLRVGWYSGRQHTPAGLRKQSFDYLKLGPYIEHLGGLKSPTTNQRLYKQQADGTFTDITSRFWKK